MIPLDTSLLERGGPVMWVLLAVSLFGFIIFIERTLLLHRGQIRTEGFMQGIKNSLRRGRRLEALTLCEDIPGPIPGIVKAILLQSESGEAKMRQAAEAAALVEIPILERRIGSLAAVARIAPLIGLLGTVVAMIQAFFLVDAGSTDAYPSFGTMLGGMGEALLTTAVGIMIAIMAQVAHHFLYGRVRALVHDLEYSAHDLIQFLVYDFPREQENRDESGKTASDSR